MSDDYQAKHAAQLAGSGGATWGVWHIPESELQVLGEVGGRRVLELGCGAAQWSIALAKAGAEIIGLDNSDRQLEHARANMARAGVEFPLVLSSAESTPFERDEFEIAFCDWGGMSFGDPYKTIPEVARILRPHGLLAFNTGTPIADLVWADGADHPGERLVRDYWGLHEIPEPGEPTGFQLGYGEWIRLFAENGFTVEALIELRPPDDATSSYRDESDREWAARWPMENIWKVRLAGSG